MAKIELDEAKAGHWYVDESGRRLLCLGQNKSCLMFVTKNRDGDVDIIESWEGNAELIELDGCTGWDWKSYADRQAECGIKVGDQVRVLRIAESDEDGWPDAWVPTMDKAVGKICEVRGAGEDGIGLPVGEAIFNFPYFVLERIRPSVAVGDGWHQLEPGQIVVEGDEWWDHVADMWRKDVTIGTEVGERGTIYRRRSKLAEPKYRPFKDIGEFLSHGGHERWFVQTGSEYIYRTVAIDIERKFVRIGATIWRSLPELFEGNNFIDPVTGETEPCGVRDDE